MSAQHELMKQVKMTLSPINEALAALDDADHGDGDLLINRSAAMSKVLGSRYVSLKRVGDAYHAVFTRDQMANAMIFTCDSLAVFEAGAASREASACHVLGNVELIDQLYMEVDAEDPRSVSDMVARGHIEEAEELLAEAIKTAMAEGDDILKVIAKKMINSVKLHQDSLPVSSRINDIVTLVSKNKAMQEAQTAQDAPVRTVCGDKVVHLFFPSRPRPHEEMLPSMVSGE